MPVFWRTRGPTVDEAAEKLLHGSKFVATRKIRCGDKPFVLS